MGCSFQASSRTNSITGTFSSHFPVFVQLISFNRCLRPWKSRPLSPKPEPFLASLFYFFATIAHSVWACRPVFCLVSVGKPIGWTCVLVQLIPGSCTAGSLPAADEEEQIEMTWGPPQAPPRGTSHSSTETLSPAAGGTSQVQAADVHESFQTRKRG